MKDEKELLIKIKDSRHLISPDKNAIYDFDRLSNGKVCVSRNIFTDNVRNIFNIALSKEKKIIYRQTYTEVTSNNSAYKLYKAKKVEDYQDITLEEIEAMRKARCHVC